jgi:hypothetical protein
VEEKLVTVNTLVLKDQLKYEGVVLVDYEIKYPEFKSSSYQLALPVINKYYKAKAQEFLMYIRTEMFTMAVEQYKQDIANGYPVRVYEAMQVFEMTYNLNCIISLYFDRYTFTGGAHGSTVRSSQTWNLQKLYMIKLQQLVLCPPDYKTYILAQVKKQIEKEPDIYFEDYAKLIADTFNPESFYCTTEGIVVYYQQYDIAPYSSGIREFLMPYSACVIDPSRTCFKR